MLFRSDQFKSKGNSLVNSKGDVIHIHHEPHINGLDWSKYNVDYVIDASGILDNVEYAQDLVRKQN